jgi:putative endonuclease
MGDVEGAFLYIVQCADLSYYVGTSRKDLNIRLTEHNAGLYGYTARRRPLELIFSQHFESIADAVAAERQVTGWSRGKKEALMRGDWEQVQALSWRRELHPSRRPPPAGSSG